MKTATIIFPLQDNKVFLSMKKKSFGAGFYNGYGGKVEKDENIIDGAIRELREEGGVTAIAQDMEKVAIINFLDDTTPLFECHVFFVRNWTGEFKESDEMTLPTAYDTDKLPLEKMWKADLTWLPLVFSGKKIHGKAYYKPGMNEMDHFEYEVL